MVFRYVFRLPCLNYTPSPADDSVRAQVRFMNSRVEGNGINSEAAALRLLEQVRFSGMSLTRFFNPVACLTFSQLGLTPLGTQLDAKIIQPLLLGPARSGQLKKPLLIVILTDGTPAGEPKEQVFNVIMRTNQDLQRTRVSSRTRKSSNSNFRD